MQTSDLSCGNPYQEYKGIIHKELTFNSTISEITEEFSNPDEKGESTVSEFGLFPGAKEERYSYNSGISFQFYDNQLYAIYINKSK